MRPSPQLIAELVCEEFDAPLSAMFRTSTRYNEERRIAVMLTYDLSGLSPRDVAAFFRIGTTTARDMADAITLRADSNPELARHIAALRDRIGPVDLSRCGPRIEDAKIAAGEYFGITQSDFISASRAHAIARPRQIAMREARILTCRSTPDIGRNFGHRDHTTVLHAVRRIDALCLTDAKVRDAVEAVHANAMARVERRRSGESALTFPPNPSAAIPPLPRGADCPGSAPPASGEPSLR